MSFQAMTWAALQPCKNAAQKLVLLMLANHANGHTGQCNPSHSRLAQECCMSVSSLKVQIKALEQAGYLHIIRKTKDGVNLPNQYTLNITAGGSEFEGVGQNLPEGGSESGYKPVIKPITIITNESAEILNFEQRECYDWAKNHDYWHFAAVSVEKFLTIYTKPKRDGLKAQFDEHKKAAHLGGASRLDCEISKTEKSTRANYATHYPNNKKLTAAQRAKQLGERANACNGANVIDSTATHL
ncbi:MAG: helix-turn-helix domain-containing protein [Methylococcaceae bacterium]